MSQHSTAARRRQDAETSTRAVRGLTGSRQLQHPTPQTPCQAGCPGGEQAYAVQMTPTRAIHVAVIQTTSRIPLPSCVVAEGHAADGPLRGGGRLRHSHRQWRPMSRCAAKLTDQDASIETGTRRNKVPPKAASSTSSSTSSQELSLSTPRTHRHCIGPCMHNMYLDCSPGISAVPGRPPSRRSVVGGAVEDCVSNCQSGMPTAKLLSTHPTMTMSRRCWIQASTNGSPKLQASQLGSPSILHDANPFQELPASDGLASQIHVRAVPLNGL